MDMTFFNPDRNFPEVLEWTLPENGYVQCKSLHAPQMNIVFENGLWVGLWHIEEPKFQTLEEAKIAAQNWWNKHYDV